MPAFELLQRVIPLPSLMFQTLMLEAGVKMH